MEGQLSGESPVIDTAPDVEDVEPLPPINLFSTPTRSSNRKKKRKVDVQHLWTEREFNAADAAEYLKPRRTEFERGIRVGPLNNITNTQHEVADNAMVPLEALTPVPPPLPANTTNTASVLPPTNITPVSNWLPSQRHYVKSLVSHRWEHIKGRTLDKALP